MENKDVLKTSNLLSEGYGMIPKKVMKDKDLSIEAKAIFSFLCSYTGKGDTAFPSVQLITDRLGISRQRYNKHREALEAKGYITVTQERTDGGNFKRNIYQINFFSPTLQNPTSGEPTTEKPMSDVPTTENLTNNNNTSINNTINNNKRDKNNTKEHARFEDFYNLYNKKKARPKASRAFIKAISNHDWETIESGTIAYLKSIRAGDERYQCHPATFLNEERFLDDHEYVKGNLYETDSKQTASNNDSDFLEDL